MQQLSVHEISLLKGLSTSEINRNREEIVILINSNDTLKTILKIV